MMAAAQRLTHLPVVLQLRGRQLRQQVADLTRHISHARLALRSVAEVVLRLVRLATARYKHKHKHTEKCGNTLVSGGEFKRYALNLGQMVRHGHSVQLRREDLQEARHRRLSLATTCARLHTTRARGWQAMHCAQ
jgi:hypothetical protein